MKILKSERKTKVGRLKRRRLRIRKRVSGDAARPRLLLRKTARHLYATAHDDTPEAGSKTLCAVSTVTRDGASSKNFCNVESAKLLGKQAAEALKQAGYESIVFDRGGYRYHGIVRAFAEAMREGGIKF